MEAAASIAGLIALADLVFRYSIKYVQGVKGARKEVEDISREISNLSLVLHRLSFIAISFAETQSSDGTEATSNITLHHLYDCQELLTRLRKRLSDAKSETGSESRFKRIQGQLKWPFSSDETKGILQDLERQKQTIDLALAADSLKSLTLVLSRQSATNSGINQVQDTVKRILDIESRIILDKKRRSVLEFFTKANPQSEFATNRELRKGLTGLWLTQGPEFEDWYRTPGSKVWCSGIPGAGKSVLAAAIIDECLQRNVANPGAALAYFFCTYRDERTHHPVSILATLCSQLARQNENAFQVLEEYHDELTSERQLQAEASAKKLTKVLRTMCTFFDRVYLIVDGLDECGEQVKKSVGTLAALLPSPDETLNLALLSRDEVPIREIVGRNFHNIEIEAHTEDIQLYVATELEERIASGNLKLGNLNLKDVITTRLVDGAKGMFRWVACQLDALCKLPRDRDRRKALDKLPPTLFDTYERILAGVNDSPDENKQLVQKTLLLISSPYHMRLSLRQICEAISLSDDEEELLDEDIVDGEEVLRLCGSLVRKRIMPYYDDDDGIEFGIEFSHFSVQEYLQGPCLEHPTLSVYGVSREKACSLLASLCLDYLTLKNHEQLPKVLSDSEDEAIDAMFERDLQRPFYRHAATLWPFYVREVGEGCCLERIRDLFQLPKTPSFCLWATTLAAHSMSMDFEEWQEDASQWLEKPSFDDMTFHVLRPDFTPLHMAAILGMPDLCDHLLKQGASVNIRCKFGTPLHCAIVGLRIFTFDSFDLGSPKLNEWKWFKEAEYFNKVGQLLGRRQSFQVLLEAEANPQLCFISTQKETCSCLSLAAMSLCEEYGLEIVVELVKAGITIEKEDLVHFQERYATILDVSDGDEYGERQVVVSLLGVLNPTDQEMEGTPTSCLYTETYKWAISMGIMNSDQLSTTRPTEEFSDAEMIDLISAWIRSNNDLELGRFLEGSRCELVKATKFGSSNGSSLHLAIRCSSLDVLKILLEHGLDANISDETGKTPAHWCHGFEANQLRMLLEHGASTLLPDKTLETVWHTAAGGGRTTILEVLIELDVTQEALKMVSSKNETPICSALNNRKTDAVLLLLKHCNSGAFWKSGRSIYRAAAEMGSAKIIQHLLDAGIEVDGMDEMAGSPLHFLSTETTVECVQILKDLFPLGQRRKEDLRTPLESLLLRAVQNRVVLDRELLEVMLSDSAVSNTKEASSLWSFLGFEVTKSAMTYHSTNYTASLKDYASAFVTLGIMAKYEEERGDSASLPFMSAITLTASNMYKTTLEGAEQPKRHPCWDSLSNTTQHVMGQSKHLDSVVGKPAATRFLSLAILHDDVELVSLLIDKGFDMHSRLDQLSPFEFACFPNVPVSEKSFALLLKHASPEKISEGNESLLGCGSLHFTAGTGRTRYYYYDWKLKQMLGAGVDPNLPLSAKTGSPLACHIRRGSMSTAEMLLEAGADPWARGSYPFDATLEAVTFDRHSILTKIMAINGQSPCWDRTWASVYNNKRSAGGNALHLASMLGNTKCLEFYLDRGLLPDLECRDDVFDTPMHYAAHFNRSATIEFLKARGGNIDARNRFGLTPLHIAANGGYLEVAKTLTNLGAKHQACNQGAVPLVYAYARGNAAMIEALQSSSEKPQESNAPDKSPRTLKILAEAMSNAILRRDVESCEKILALGCPVDVELYDEVPVTPLAVAICRQEDPEVVQCLVDAGATVSTIFPQPYQDRYLSALEAAIAHPRFNSILHKLLNKFLEEGGDFLDMARGPLHLAIDYDNIEGLRILLSWLRETYGSSELNLNKSSRVVEKKSSQSETLSAFIDQKDAEDQGTALHIAASENNLDACAILISSLANIEETNDRNETPLHLAAVHGSLQVAKHLLDCGAHTNPLDTWDETPLMCAYRERQRELVDLLTPYCKDTTRTNILGENVLHFMARFESDPTGEGSSLETLSRCIEQGASLYLPDGDGVTPIQWILAEQSAYNLRFLLNRDHRFLRPQETARWPGDWFLANYDRFAATSKNLRLVRPFLSNHDLRQLCVVVERGDHSLLCRAACLGSVEVIEALLALGVDMIEHECKDHGTPLTAAISRGHIKAVKCLVRNGATVPYDLCQPNDFEVSVGKPGFAARQWLFVGRHVEQSRISNVMAEASGKAESWAGVRTVRVALKWEWKRHRGEVIWEYACRRQKILKDVRGKVVKCLEETTEGEDAGSDASDEKISGRHYCLGRGRVRGAILVY